MTPKLEAAVDMLEKKGLARNSYAPPLLRALWSLGLEVPPPVLVGFTANAVVSALAFGPAWGGLMWLLVWQRQGMKPAPALVASAMAGAMFGVFMAAWLRHRRLKQQLPLWRDFTPPPR